MSARAGACKRAYACALAALNFLSGGASAESTCRRFCQPLALQQARVQMLVRACMCASKCACERACECMCASTCACVYARPLSAFDFLSGGASTAASAFVLPGAGAAACAGAVAGVSEHVCVRACERASERACVHVCKHVCMSVRTSVICL